MKTVLDFVIVNWLILTMIMSVFWGFRGAYIDYRSRSNGYVLNNNDNPPLIVKAGFVILWSTYQFILNFTGSLAGWCCLYILVMKIQPNFLQNFGLNDFFLFFISFMGITGLLPQSIYGIVCSLEKLTGGITAKLLK